MACASQSMLSANSYPFPSQGIFKRPRRVKGFSKPFSVNASSSPPSSEESDCNAEECAPDKEIGMVSMEWLAGEKTKVIGTYPPKKKGWTGYVEKDTAGQTNIYSVEPTVYVAENAISSGAAGTSSEGSENTVAITAGLALISVAAASFVLLQVGKSTPQVQTVEYSGPPLSYYINKFKPSMTVEASVPSEAQNSPTVEASVPPEASTSSTVEASAPPQPQILSESDAKVVPRVQVELEVAGPNPSMSNVS